MKLAGKLDEITRKFWDTWRTWRLGQGWALGIDLPNQKVSPHLVGSFDQLTPEGSEWFRQHTALLLHALDDDLTLESPAVAPPSEPLADPTLPRLRAEIEKHRTETNGLLLQISMAKVSLDQEIQKTDIERALRNEAEKKLTKIEPVIAELKATILPTTKAVEAAQTALVEGNTALAASHLRMALISLVGEPPAMEAEEITAEVPMVATAEAPKPKAEKKPRSKKKAADWS